jgi:putative copper export protein
MGLQVLAGHAAAPSGLRPVNLLAQWLHLLAAGVWAGGLVWLLTGLLDPRRREPSDTDAVRVDRVMAVRRFSRLALPVVGVLAVTGLDRALDLAGCCPPWPGRRVALAPCAAALPLRLGSWRWCCWPRPC